MYKIIKSEASSTEKFISPLVTLKLFRSRSSIAELKLDKFIELSLGSKLYEETKEFKNQAGSMILLTQLVSIGLDRFIKSIENPGIPISVQLDLPINVKEMYIKSGAAFVIPSNNTDMENLKGLLDSEDVIAVFS